MGEVLSFEEFHSPVRPVTGGRAGRCPIVFFTRRELDQILQLYSRMVILGEWHDYALSHSPNGAVFAIFRRSSQGPLYRIVKRPGPARRGGDYELISAGGRTVKRGRDLVQLLNLFNRGRLRVV